MLPSSRDSSPDRVAAPDREPWAPAAELLGSVGAARVLVANPFGAELEPEPVVADPDGAGPVADAEEAPLADVGRLPLTAGATDETAGEEGV